MREAASSAPFRFCPRCGAGGPSFDGRRWLCRECGFEYFQNVATAVGVILDLDGPIAFVERAKEPAAGKLGLPGGFVDPRERAEDALLRECVEEIGWAPPAAGLEFLASFPNAYKYGGVLYDTCDLYFYYRLPEGAAPPNLAPVDGESKSIKLMRLDELCADDLAFDSLRRAIRMYAEIRPGLSAGRKRPL